MPRLFQKRNGTWSEILSVFQKQNGTWSEILNIFKKINGTWTKVFSGSKVPGNTIAPTITGSGYLYGTLTNNSLGTWTNTPTSYSRQWRRGTPPAEGGEPQGYSNISGATSSTYVTTLSDNGKYIVCQVTATNAVGPNTAVSNPIYVKKYDPVSLQPYTLSGSPTVGATLTAQEQIGSWKNTTTNSGDTYPDTFEYEWSYSDGTIIQSSTLSFTSYPRNINSNSLLIINDDLNKTIRVRVTGTNSGASATSAYTSSGTITSVYSFNFGNILYVGSNGYITLDQAPSVAIAALPAGNGRTINIWNEDLVNYRIQEYSDSSNYYLYFRSYRYQSPLVQSAVNALDYQIKFYTGQAYCDIYLLRKGSSVPTYIDNPGYYANGLFQGTGIAGPFFWGAGSVLRVYFNGTVASTSVASWTAISDSLWKNVSTATIDDSYVAVTTSANQQAPVLTAPSITSVSSTVENAAVTAYFSGGSGPYYQIYWTTGAAPGAGFTPDQEGSSSPLTDNSGPPTSGYTYYMYVRSVDSLGNTTAGPSSVASAWSSGYAFTVSSANLTPPTITNVTAGNSSGQPVTVYFTGGSGPYYQIWWTLGVGGTGYDEYGTSSPITDNTGPTSASTVWYAYVRSVSSLTNVGTGPSLTISNWSTGYQFTVTQAPIIPTITMNANTSVGTGGATINWSSTNQSYAYVDGTYVGNVNSYTFTGKSSSTFYSGTVTVYSTTGDTASASYSFTTTSATITPTVSMNANSGISTSGATINWSSTNQSYAYVDGTYVGNVNSYTFSGLSSSTFYSGTVTVYSSTNTAASASYSFTTSTPAPVAPTITSGPFISWGSGNNYTLSATASNATNLEFQVQYSSSSSGSPSTGSATYFFGASSGGGTTGAQASNRSWARTRVRANNTTTGLSSAFTAYTAYS